MKLEDAISECLFQTFSNLPAELADLRICLDGVPWPNDNALVDRFGDG